MAMNPLRVVCLLALFALTLFSPALLRAQEFTCGQSDSNSDLSRGEIDAVVSALEAHYKEIEGLSAAFTQDSLFLGFNETIKSSGELVFKKPGMMDWQYTAPEKQRFIANGRTLWFYQEELNQVTIGQFQQSFQSGLPVSFLLGLGSLSNDFSVQRACRNAQGSVLELSPKQSDANLDQFSLLVDDKRNLPIGAKIVDVGGNVTQILFSELKERASLDEKRFEFQIPKGVDIIDQRDGAGLEQ